MKTPRIWSVTAEGLIFTLGLMALAFQATTAEPAQGALCPNGETGPLLTLSENGKTAYVLVTAADAPPPARQAAEELQQWLGAMTGAEFTIVPDGTPAQSHEISVGRTRRLIDAGIDAARVDLKEDGYAIATAGEKLFLIGGSRGPASAVFALLEEDLGCRWYSVDNSHIPQRPTLRFRPAVRHYVPVFRHREATGYSHDRRMHTWCYRNRVGPFPQSLPEDWGGEFDFAGPSSVHTFGRFFGTLHFKQHPEYYAMNTEGKRYPKGLCLTHPKVAEIMIERVLDVLAEHPNSEAISVSQNDGPHFCRCETCTALAEQEGSRSGPIIQFVNTVAEAVEKEYPDVLVETLAYTYSVDPPRHIRPRENVGVRLCTDRNTWPFPFLEVSKTHATYEALKGWSAICKHVLIWDYKMNFSYSLLPTPQIALFKPDLQIFADHHVMAYFVQGFGADRSDMKNWIAAKLFWDPRRDARALQAEFIGDVYGQAAEPIAEYNAMLWNMTTDVNAQALAGRRMATRRGPEWALRQVAVVPQEWPIERVPESAWVSLLAAQQGVPGIPTMTAYGTRFPATARFFDEVFLARAKDCFDRAEALAEDDTILRRVHTDRLSIMYLELSRLYSLMLQTGTLPDKTAFAALTDRFEQLAKHCFGEKSVLWRNELAPFVDLLRDAGQAAPPAERHTLETDNGERVDIYKLGSEWRFRADPLIEGIDRRWFAKDLDESDWGYVRTHTRGGLEKQGYPDFEGFGWYRQTVRVPADMQGQHLYLYFGAVDEDAWVYIDGRHALDSIAITGLTPHQVWNTPFSKEVTESMAPGQSHQLTVRFIDRSGMAGIWKPVFLVASDAELTTDQITTLVARTQGDTP